MEVAPKASIAPGNHQTTSIPDEPVWHWRAVAEEGSSRVIWNLGGGNTRSNLAVDFGGNYEESSGGSIHGTDPEGAKRSSMSRFPLTLVEDPAFTSRPVFGQFQRTEDDLLEQKNQGMTFWRIT